MKNSEELDCELLYLEYVTNNKSISQISEEYKTYQKKIFRLLKKFNIESKENKKISYCDFCKAEIKKGDNTHKKKCQAYLDIINVITKELLIKLYFSDQMSAIDIGEKFNLNCHSIYSIMESYGIKRKKLTDSAKQSDIKRRQTNIEKTGYEHNFCKDHPSRKKWESELLENEGITNVFQRQEVKDKIVKTLVEKYGEEYYKVINPCRGKNIYSAVHKSVVEKLIEKGVELTIEKKLETIDNSKIRKHWFYSYDIFIEPNFLIEVNGDYWHGNPLIYKESDLILKGSEGELIVKDKWEKDRIKIEHAKSCGYKILVVWERDIKQSLEGEVEKILKFIQT